MYQLNHRGRNNFYASLIVSSSLSDDETRAAEATLFLPVPFREFGIDLGAVNTFFRGKGKGSLIKKGREDAATGLRRRPCLA